VTDLATALLASLDDQALEALAARLRPFLPAPAVDGYLDTTSAAQYLCCSPGRIHDLVQLGKLVPLRDGRRLLFKRSGLDAYLEARA
jgi:excisionase family DNA binding protein